MKSFLQAAKGFLEGLVRVAKIALSWLFDVIQTFIVWVSPPPRLSVALLGLAFAISLLSWALWSGQSSYVLYFPSLSSGTLRGEVRQLPNRPTPEGRAELLASEFLLGPRDPGLAPAIPPGTRLDGVLLRKASLFVNLGEEGALLDRPELDLALKALRMTLSPSVRQARRIVITIGGQEPWTTGLSQPGLGGKKL